MHNKVTVQKWIPVTSRLPEHHVETFQDIDGEEYIVTISDFVLGVTSEGIMVTVQHEVGEDKEWWLDYYTGEFQITHWMPLPEAPKGE